MTLESPKNPAPAPAFQPSGCPRCAVKLERPYKYCPNCSYRLRPDLVRHHITGKEPIRQSQRLLAIGGYLGFVSLLLLLVLTGLRLFESDTVPPVKPLRRIKVAAKNVSFGPDDLQDVSEGEVSWGAYRPVDSTGVLRDLLRRMPTVATEEGQMLAAETVVLAREDPQRPLHYRAVEVLKGKLADPQIDLSVDSGTRQALSAAPDRFVVLAKSTGENWLQLGIADPELTGLIREVLDASLSELDDWLERTRSVLEEQTRALLPDLYRVDDPFRIGVAEISNEQWYAFLDARAKKSGKPAPAEYYPASWTRASPERLVPRLYPAAGSGKPVSDISFVAALEFCNWVWEEILGAEPDLIVDLPTPFEFARAGRGDSLDNFPWGVSLTGKEGVVLTGEPLAARSDEDKKYRGLYAQVGNVAEWIHYQDGCAAAGWSYSYLGSGRSFATNRGQWTTPFSSDEIEEYTSLSDRAAHIGFRIVLRRTPSMPHFIPVSAGPVRFVARTNPIMPPTRQKFDANTGEFSRQQLPPVEMPTQPTSVSHDFEIATNEITNRQYLAYLVEEAPKFTAEYKPSDTVQQRSAKDQALLRRQMALLPGGFQLRPHPFRGRDLVYVGPFGDGDSIPELYEPGRATHPVQGVTPSQAQAYATWLSRKLAASVRLPTAAEYVRAGRGDGASPYPWGESRGKRELICAGRADDQDRARSLQPFLSERPDAILGLCGNVLELVEAPEGVVRPLEEPDPTAKDWLLAGGSYDFEAEGCTLDSFLDQQWKEAEVQRDVDPDDDGPPDSFLDRIDLARLTGFRVVREAKRR